VRRLSLNKNFITFISFIVIIALFILPLDAANSRQNSETKILPGKFVVKFKPAGLSKKVNTSAVSRISGQYAVQSMKQVFSNARNIQIKEQLNLQNVYIMETAASENIWQIVKELSKDPEVEYAEPVYLQKMTAEPNDPLYSAQYHLPQVYAPEAWDIGYGNDNVIIGVIDTGVDWDHEDLADLIWTNEDEVLDGEDSDGNGFVDDIRGWDFVTGVSGDGDGDAHPDEDGEDPDNNPMDFEGHGTHVAGIAAANTNNDVGIASVSSGARIMPLRIGWRTNDGNGYGYSSWMAEAYLYAADNGADITNLSFGNSGQLIVDAAFYAFLNGVLIVESAGNDDEIAPSALGSQPWVISVAALNENDVKSSYSSYGPYVAVSAPGNSILSSVVLPSDFYGGEQYVYKSGTSMAAPLVASVAGLVKAHEPELTSFDLFSRVVGTADNIDAVNPQYVGSLGTGRVNAYRALTEVVNSEPDFVIVGSTIDDLSGNDDGFLDPGEQASLTLVLRNRWQSATNVMVEISSDENSPIVIESEAASVGDVGGILDPENWETEATFSISCSEDALPLSQELTVTIYGDGFSSEIVYYLPISPRVLLVADFEATSGDPLDFSSFYQNAFVSNGISHDMVHHSETTIDFDLLSRYPIVVWGCEWMFPSLDASDRAALQAYLDNGGALFLSGQDIAWDLGADNSGSNEYYDSNGESGTFLNTYLKSDYIADVAGFSDISGVDNDPISDGIDVDFFQLLRESSSQYPDVIAPRETASSVFNYFNGLSGAIRYDGDYRLVYFGFAGFEGITEESKRNILMRRIINYLDGIEIVHERQRDTEQTAGEYIFTADVYAANDNITGAELYWSNDAGVTINKVDMINTEGNNYTVTISAQESGSTVDYFIYATTESGKYAFTDEYSFHIGPDLIAPTVNLTNPYITQTINAFGPAPYDFIVKIDDNLGIDSSTAYIYFSVNEGDMDSTSLSYLEKDMFTGTFSFVEPLSIGDQVDYFAGVKDFSSNRNSGASETHSFQVDTFQVIDDFENGDWRWDLGKGWEIVSYEKYTGDYSITDSPVGNYENNEDNPLTFKFPFNFSIYQFAQIDFYIKQQLKTGDSLLVEISNDDGQNWDKVDGYSGSAFSYRHKIIDISAYTGVGNENVGLRFRLVSDAEEQHNGVWIDDINIVVSEQALAIEDQNVNVPLTYSLKQNYPNPFNPSTTIKYSLPKSEQVDLIIYTITGEKVKTLVSDKIEAGYHSVQWNGVNDQGLSVASGIYIYRIQTKGFNKSMKMLFLK